MNFVKSIFKWFKGPYKFPGLVLLTVVLLVYLVHLSIFKSSIKIETEKPLEYVIENDDDLLFSNRTRTPFPGERLIHFDLKGAPPKIAYLLKFFPFIKNLGATGILMEYEDSFPYHSDLEELSAKNAYTRSNIIEIIETARVNNLKVIPLIPTFGHFEFVLKLEQYRRFREIAENPQVLCPSENDVYLLLYKMIDQVLEVHNTSTYLHIGCDEVDYLAACQNCREMMRQNKWRRNDIYFNHIKKIAQYVTQNYPNVRPIVWSDKFVKKNERLILRHGLPDLVDVMFWNYNPEKKSFPTAGDMESYTKLYKTIWIANAFKGATGSTEMITNIDYHLRNTKGWMDFFEKWNSKLDFKGIAITGWQRYNHFMVLCELLPVGVPSLAFVLQYINRNGGLSVYDDVKHSLNCNDFLPINLVDIKDLELLSRLQCDFPGFKIYHVVHSFYNTVVQIKSELAKLRQGDFAFYNVVHNITNPLYLQHLNKLSYERHLFEVEELETKLKEELSVVYDEYTVNEWIMTNVLPIRMQLEAAAKTIDALKSVKVWSRRPQVSETSKVKHIFNRICGSNETRGCTFFNMFTG